MKKILIYIIIACMGTVIPACDTFLEEPLDNYRTLDNIFDTPEGASAFMGGSLKAPFTDYQYYKANYHQLLGMNSGILGRRAGAAKFDGYYTLTQNPTTPILDKMYAIPYVGIAASNIMLSLVDANSTSEHELNVIGVSKFFRAVNYFNQVRLFGRVPIVTKPYKEGDEPVGRAETLQEVYDLIEADLLDAFELMQVEQIDGTNPSKWAAKAYLAKLYLQMAGNSLTGGVGTGDAALWEKVKENALAVINSEHYSLVSASDYSEMFSPEGGFSSESILEIAFANAKEAGSAMHLFYGGHENTEAWVSGKAGIWGRIVVLRETYDRMLDACQGKPDDRMDAALLTEWDRLSGNPSYYTYPALKGDMTGTYLAYPAIAKYVDPLAYDKQNAGNNFIACRLPEMYLIAAEAMNELGDQAGAYNILKPILARGGAGHYPDAIPAGLLDQKAMFDFIMGQRLVELIGEVQEWFDARRRGTTYFKEICVNHNARLDLAKTDQSNFKDDVDFYFDTDDKSIEKNLLLPIPLGAIDANPALAGDQNPGY
jgi:hypothetical protein